jgi:hypothetical protein
MGDSNIDGDGGGVDGDGSGGNSLSRQGAGIETSIPQTSSSMAAGLRNFSGRNVDCVEVYKWIVLALSISSDFWLRWLVHEA